MKLSTRMIKIELIKWYFKFAYPRNMEYREF